MLGCGTFSKDLSFVIWSKFRSLLHLECKLRSKGCSVGECIMFESKSLINEGKHEQEDKFPVLFDLKVSECCTIEFCKKSKKRMKEKKKLMLLSSSYNFQYILSTFIFCN